MSNLTFDQIAGFKHTFIGDVLSATTGSEAANLLCWIKTRPRRHSKIVFIDVIDSTAEIQVIVQKELIEDLPSLLDLWPESSLRISGKTAHYQGRTELIALKINIISRARRILSPAVRSTNPEILATKYVDYTLKYRHVYLRNPLLAACQQFRSKAFFEVRTWFEEHRFLDLSAPLITPSILYSPSAAIHIGNLKGDRPLFLSQCAGFYLEAGAHAFERVYNLGPSFRNESRTNRHLMEYWHIKAELSSGDLNDIMILVELFLRDITAALSDHGLRVVGMLGAEYPLLKLPFKRITYRDAISKLRSLGHGINFGDNISKPCEDALTSTYGGQPLWITHKPRSLEPFPYAIDPTDEALSMTADLIAPGGFGEICGVAEKSWSLEELDVRLAEKGKKIDDEAYLWVRELREFGMVPHTAFGMGLERVIRWLLGLEHVKDTIPFPRIFGRYPFP